MIKDILQKQHKLIAVQVSVFGCLMALLLVVGAIVYNKTSIHDRENAIQQRQSITGGFEKLQQNAE